LQPLSQLKPLPQFKLLAQFKFPEVQKSHLAVQLSDVVAQESIDAVHLDEKIVQKKKIVQYE
jgi:hypothetical protein